MKKAILFLLAAVLAVPAVFAQNDSEVQAAVQKALSASRFKGIQASVQGGIATLTGTVDVYDTKLNADQKVRHVKGVSAIRDEVQVAGPEIPDQELQAKLQKAIAYGLLGYVPVQFQAITVQVHNGVVELGGDAAGPIAASDALAIVENTKGVKDVINNINVDPPSPMDDQIRMAVYRKVYGQPMLNQYAIDPEKPIRIQVLNGHVTLYGVVDNQAEKNVAGIQANSVPGVFSVTNDLQVAGASGEKPGK
jgi:hyperosmotically inducible periplasmic protein